MALRYIEKQQAEEKAALDRALAKAAAELQFWRIVRATLIGLVIFMLVRTARAEEDDEYQYQQEDSYTVYSKDFHKKEAEVRTLANGKTVVYSRDFSKVVAEVEHRKPRK